MKLIPEDGTIQIEFESPNGTGPAVVTVRPPKVGAYRRLRKELISIDVGREKFIADLPEGTSTTESNNLATEYHENALLAWWQLVLVGDDTFARLTADAVPENREDWPMELALNPAAIGALSHWITHPLGSSVLPTAPNSQQPVPDLSTEPG